MKLNGQQFNLLLKDGLLLYELSFFVSILLLQSGDFLIDVVFTIDRYQVVESIH